MAIQKAAIIGGGLGGLSAAIYARLEGLEVDLYEAHSETGGKAASIEMEGFRFDTGPSLLTMPFVLEELFSAAKRNMSDYLELTRLEESCRYFYPDGSIIQANEDRDVFGTSLEQATIDTRDSLFRYLDYSKTIYDLTANLFLYHDFHEMDTFREHADLETLKNLGSIDMFRTVHGANRSFFNDQKTIQFFDRYATFNGSSPFKAPATLNIIPHVEYTLGSFVPRGGIIQIPRALDRLARELGVNIYTSTRVNAVNLEKKKVRGIQVNGEDRDYDLVISNVDVNVLYRDLLKDTRSRDARRYRKLEPSSSALVFLWGIDRINEDLATHNIFFSTDYTREFKELFNKKICPHDPTVYVYTSSRFNSQDAPREKENWFVMINSPHDNGQDWEYEKKESRNRVLSRLKTAGFNIEQHICCEHTITPVDIEKRTSSFRGSLYGISSNTKAAAFLRQRNRSLRYPGLFFTGGSAHPGGGIPLVILSGKIAVDLVRKHYL